MSNRIRICICVLVCGFACTIGRAFAQTPLEPGHVSAAKIAPIEFRLAQGEVGACGPGCSEWIAAEGRIDADAAGRLRQLLKKLGDRRLPIFFHSPGGQINGALELGRLIHQKKLEVSIGRTVKEGCDTDKPDGACDAQAVPGGEVKSKISQFVAECNSGCVYALAAGMPHVIPPWIKVGIHDAGLDPDTKLPRGASLVASMRVVHEKLKNYLREMGIDSALFVATLDIPFEKVKLLQRDDIVRFGLDRREFGETAWQFADTVPAQIRKRFFVRADGEQPHYVNGLLQVACSSGFGVTVALVREALASDENQSSAGPPVTSIGFRGKQVPVRRVKSPQFYVLAGRVPSLDGVMEAAIDLPGTELGRREKGGVTVSMEGFSAAYAKLRSHCSRDGQQTALKHFSPGSLEPKIAQSPAQLASVPLANKTLPTVEFSRVALGEQKFRIDFLFLLRRDCSSAGPGAIGIIEQPQHGTVSIEKNQGQSDFPDKDPRAACNSQKTDGLAVFYQPSEDYQGTDSVAVFIAPPLGNIVIHHYAIEVK